MDESERRHVMCVCVYPAVPAGMEAPESERTCFRRGCVGLGSDGGGREILLLLLLLLVPSCSPTKTKIATAAATAAAIAAAPALSCKALLSPFCL